MLTQVEVQSYCIDTFDSDLNLANFSFIAKLKLLPILFHKRALWQSLASQPNYQSVFVVKLPI